jgi:hypothetical protein
MTDILGEIERPAHAIFEVKPYLPMLHGTKCPNAASLLAYQADIARSQYPRGFPADCQSDKALNTFAIGNPSAGKGAMICATRRQNHFFFDARGRNAVVNRVFECLFSPAVNLSLHRAWPAFQGN